VNLRKWGGVFVFLGAVSPLPHSMVSMACGLIKYNFKHYLLLSLFRYVRFLVYALVIFQVF
ncbi:MAG: short-chain dehydrogenase, partial [Flavobacteriales bacterium]|nr:short-chain dehydrogenase [Flavobacteriales bacterium]